MALDLFKAAACVLALIGLFVASTKISDRRLDRECTGIDPAPRLLERCHLPNHLRPL